MGPRTKLVKELIEQYTDQIFIYEQLPCIGHLTRAFPIVTSPIARKNGWILYIHLNTC